MVSELLRCSATIFVSPSSLHSFLLLSTLLFSFRYALHVGSLSLSSALDHNPNLHSLLSRLNNNNNNNRHGNDDKRLPPFSRYLLNNHNNNPQLPLSPSSIFHLDDDVSNSNNRKKEKKKHRPSNSNLTFLPDPNQLSLLTLKLPKHHQHQLATLLLIHDPTATIDTRSSSFHLDRRDTLSLIHVASLFALAHLYAIFGFLLSYSLALGIVSLSATASLLNRPSPPLSSASRLGLRRLPLLLFLRWSLRDTLLQFLTILFFSDVTDQFSLLKLFVKLKLVPFSLTALPPSLHSIPTSRGFASSWTLLDAPVSAVFAVNCCVAIMDRSERRSGREVVKEGCGLVSRRIGIVGVIKLLEMVACGSFGMWVLTSVAGLRPVAAMAAQSVAEVYFMVVWLLFYLSARSNAGDADGRRFGSTELEELYDILRDDRRNE